MTTQKDAFCLDVAFSDLDSAGILYLGHIFTYAHKAYENWVKTSGLGWQDWFENANWAVPLVDAHAQYLIPITGGQTLCLELKITEVKTTSFISTTRIFSLDKSQEYAVVKLVHVFIDKKSKLKLPIPTEIKKVLLR